MGQQKGSILLRCLFLVLLAYGHAVFSQSIFTSTLNTTGSSKKLTSSDPRHANYTFEWSVGESSIITTNTSSELMVTHGLLQGFLLVDPQLPAALTWFPDEIKTFPNPAVNDFTVELLTTVKGVIVFTLYNSAMIPLMQRSISYQGVGSTQHFVIRHLPAGAYVLRVSAKGFPESGGYLIKQGSFKIIKVQ